MGQAAEQNRKPTRPLAPERLGIHLHDARERSILEAAALTCSLQSIVLDTALPLILPAEPPATPLHYLVTDDCPPATDYDPLSEHPPLCILVCDDEPPASEPHAAPPLAILHRPLEPKTVEAQIRQVLQVSRAFAHRERTLRVEARLQLNDLSRTLTESQSQLQAIFDNLKEGIVVLTRDYKLVHINPAAISLLGSLPRSRPSPVLTDIFDVIRHDGTIMPVELWPGVRATRGDYVLNEELVIRRKDDGTSVYTEVSTAPITDCDGNITHVIICYRDITDRRQMHQAQAQLAAIVASSADAIIGKDCEGNVTSWNHAAETLFGYTADEMIGTSIRRLLPPDLQSEEDEILRRIQRGETVTHIESTRRKKNGDSIVVSLTISPIRDQRGKVIGASKIARDITEKKQLERHLHQSQKLEAIGHLTGGIAHDFNNLLGVILGNLDLLERHVEDDPAAVKRVQTAQKAAIRGADLIRRMLTFSSKSELHPQLTHLNDAIHNVLELASRGLGPQVRVVTHLHPSLPPVVVDPIGLESSLLNLIVNARDAMPDSGTLNILTRIRKLEDDFPAIRAGEIKPGWYAGVSISDSGIGMAPSVLERVFEPFFTTKGPSKGTGLGLAMVYGFVKQSGGAVRIYSEPGCGTTVSFYLPLAAGHFEQPLPIAPTGPLPPLHAHTGTILVVDDELDLLEVAVTYIQELGYTVLQAQDASHALDIVKSQQDIDLVITDIIMPGGMNGIELAERIRSLRPEIRLILCSGFPAGALQERTTPPIAGPLLHKPYQRGEFLAVVLEVLNQQPNSHHTPPGPEQNT